MKQQNKRAINETKKALFATLFFALFLSGCQKQEIVSVPVGDSTTIIHTNNTIIENTSIESPPQPENGMVEENNLTIVLIGKTSIIITPQKEVILVRPGDESNLLEINNFFINNNITTIKYLIISVPEPDASKYIIIRYKPEHVLDTGIPSSFQEYKNYANTTSISTKTTLDTDALIEIIPPYEKGLFPQIIENSLITRITYGQQKILLLGECRDNCQQTLSETAQTIVPPTTKANLDFLVRASPETIITAKELQSTAQEQYDYLGIKTYSKGIFFITTNGETITTKNG